MAGLARQTRGYDDMILRHAHPDDHVAECIASNLFWFDEGVLCTPALETGCVDGILRRQVVRAAEAIGQPVNVGFWSPSALSLAEAVFCTNVNGIQ